MLQYMYPKILEGMLTMSLLKMPIQWKITFFSFCVVLFSLIIGGIILIGHSIDLKEEELEKRVMITARTVAQLTEIKREIQKDDGWETINPIVERIRIINNVDYIVVLNMDHVRYSHPVKDMLGKVSNGKDEGAAFAEHSYTSLAKGELGTAVRALVPIKNQNREQIGVVIVGNILPSPLGIISGLKNEIIIVMFLTLLFGIWGSWLLARQIKQQMYHLEPHEIVRILEERTAAFNAMHEAVIAIDNNEKITIFNKKAKSMLGVTGDVIDKRIDQIIPDTRLPEILAIGKPILNRELKIGQTIILSNRIPIKVKGKTVGAVAIFQDRTEVTKIAEELTGVKAFVDALRVQAHEYKNKLHTIAGLIQLGKREQALNYVFQVTDEHEELTKFLSKNIQNDSIAGLFLSKVSRGKELGIDVVIDRQSRLERFPEHLDHHDFVLIIGNLIENAFTALENGKNDMKKIFISIEQDEELCSVLVEDTGIGISKDIIPSIFEEGFTTKLEAGHGIGLFLIQKIIEKGQGDIQVESYLNEGTCFTVTFPMKITRREDYAKSIYLSPSH